MGTENSKPTVREREYSRDMAIQRALEQQRKMYEAKYTELMQTQIVIHESINRNRNSLNRSDVTNCGASTSNTLYPNLQKVANNNTVHAVVNNNPNICQPGTSNNTPHLSTAPTVSAATVPSSPLIPSAPSISSHLTAPPNNMNNKNISNRGAIPKNRKTRYAQNKNSSMGVECVTCKNDFGLQIYQCQNGHSSCSQCRFLNKICGFCSKPITDVRNITLETTIAEISIKQNTTKLERVKCHNAKDGCCLSFTTNEMANHLKECPYKDMECPLTSVFQNCAWKGKINQISTHFNDAHPQHCVADVDKEMTLININKDQRIIYFVNIGNFNFLIHIKVIESEKVIYMTTQFLGTKVSASKWTYELHIYNKKNLRRKFQYMDICYSSAESINDIFDKAQCAAIASDYAQTFLNDHCLTYKFFLKKKPYVQKNDQCI